jgi:hypothetical protein
MLIGMPRLTLVAVLVTVCFPACRNEDPAGAEALWDELQAAGYTEWTRAPGFPGRTPSTASHGDEVEIFVNDVVADALAAGSPLDAWPEGALIVKDGWRDGEPHIVAAMEKRDDGWFWAEWEPDGTILFSGTPRVCTNCHDAGEDSVRAFPLPR